MDADLCPYCDDNQNGTSAQCDCYENCGQPGCIPVSTGSPTWWTVSEEL